MTRFGIFVTSIAALILALACPRARAQQNSTSDALAAGFASPPDSARPQTWWHWMNGNVSKQGITLDLEAMKRVGIGGAHLAQVGSDIPKGPIPYDSPEMIDCIQFAASEANRLGLDFVMFNCPGWSSSGGPWITPELSMKALAVTEADVAGGTNVSAVLAQPTAKQDFYRDAYVIAFPKAESPARIPNFSSTGRPGGTRRGATTAAAQAPFADASTHGVDPAKVIDLTSKMDASGKLSWNAPAGDWTILRIGYTTNGMENHPAPDGGLGLECDKFSKEAMDFHFEHFFEKFYQSLAPLIARGKASALIDSYETGLQDWTVNFPAEFKARRGYDVMPYMPVLAQGTVVGSYDVSERFLWDVRKTKAELMNENYYGEFAAKCHEHGMKAIFEPYDPGNFDELTAGAYADKPMAEFWQNQPNQHSVKLVASVIHLNGRPIMGAESFTSQSRWTEYPFSLKGLGDFMWTQGLNQFIFHRYAMQPNPTAVPGMTMGPWGGHFDRTNTWFEQGRAWLQYVARSQFLLQQGLFRADLLYFAGEDSPVRAPTTAQLEPPLPRGYDYDNVDTVTMKNRLKIVDHKIVLPDGMTYRLFVLPRKPTMTVEAMQNLHDLVSTGMNLYVAGPAPTSTPSLMDYPKSEEKLKSLAADLWGNMDGNTVTDHAFGSGHVYWGPSLPDALKKLSIPPDFLATSQSGNAMINFIHRKAGDADIYFIANHGQSPESLVCSFAITGKQPEVWDSATGQRAKSPIWTESNGRTLLPIQLDPSGSIFVIFRGAPAGGTITMIAKDGQPVVSCEAFASSALAAPVDPAWDARRLLAFPMTMPSEAEPLPVMIGAGLPLAFAKGVYSTDHARQSVDNLPAPAEISGPWHVAFQSNRGAPADATFDKLISWPESSDEGIKYFSGTATYTNKFTAPELVTGRSLWLDLGRVQVLAEVIVNGKDLGIAWKVPFRIDITSAVHPGQNDLEVRVTNLWPNRLIGDEQLPAENEYKGPGRGANAIIKIPDWFTQGLAKPPGGRITFTTWHHWSASDALLESGLIGPVNIREAQELNFGASDNR